MECILFWPMDFVYMACVYIALYLCVCVNVVLYIYIYNIIPYNMNESKHFQEGETMFSFLSIYHQRPSFFNSGRNSTDALMKVK